MADQSPIIDDPINDKPMPLLEHLVELRRRLVWSAAAFMVAFVGCYYFSGDIFYFLARPLAKLLIAQGNGDPHLIYTQLYEAFFTYLKVAMFGAVFISFPIVASQIWMFVAPGLYRSEKRALLPFIIATPLLFFMGGALAYYVIFPTAWRFFLSFQSQTPDGKERDQGRRQEPEWRERFVTRMGVETDAAAHQSGPRTPWKMSSSSGLREPSTASRARSADNLFVARLSKSRLAGAALKRPRSECEGDATAAAALPS